MENRMPIGRRGPTTRKPKAGSGLRERTAAFEATTSLQNPSTRQQTHDHGTKQHPRPQYGDVPDRAIIGSGLNQLPISHHFESADLSSYPYKDASDDTEALNNFYGQYTGTEDYLDSPVNYSDFYLDAGLIGNDWCPIPGLPSLLATPPTSPPHAGVPVTHTTELRQSMHSQGASHPSNASHGCRPIQSAQDTPQILPHHVQSALLKWMLHCSTNNIIPANETDDIYAHATKYSIDPVFIMRFVVENATGAPALSMSRRASEQSISPISLSTPLDPSRSQDTQIDRKALADEYFAKKLRGSCNPNPARPSPGGIYRCPCPACNFAHFRFDDWKKHLENQQPQQVYVCYLCPKPSSDAKGKKPSIEHRTDKHTKHLREVHNVASGDTEDHLEFSIFRYSQSFHERCMYQVTPGAQVCGESFRSWDHELRHLAAHYRAEAGGQESDGSIARSPKPGKRVNTATSSAARQKRRILDDDDR